MGSLTPALSMEQFVQLERARSMLLKIERGDISNEVGTASVGNPATNVNHREGCVSQENVTRKTRLSSIALPNIKEALEYVHTLRPRPNVAVTTTDSKRTVRKKSRLIMEEMFQKQSARPDGIVLRTISGAWRRRIRRLPKPDAEELKRLEAIDKDLEHIKKAPSMLLVNDPMSFYGTLKAAVPSKGAELTVYKDHVSVVKEKGNNHTLSFFEPPLHPLVLARNKKDLIHPHLKPDILESDKEERSLQHQLEACEAAVVRHERSIEATLEEVVAFLGLGGPTPQQRERKRLGIRTLLETLQRVVHRRLANSWRVWKDFTRESTQILLLVSVDRLQRAWRSRFCREELAMRKKRSAQQQRRARLFVEQNITLRVTSAIKLQLAFRVYVSKGRVIYMRQQRAAAITVQCGWRKIQAHRKLFSMRLAQINLIRCAIIVQCLKRCQWARRRLRLLYKIRAVENAKVARLEAEEVVKERFARKGAIVTLQRWWRRVARVLLARAMVTVVRRRKAIVIEAWWRGTSLRLIRRREQMRKQAREKQLSAAAVVFQAQYRRKLAVRRAAAVKEAKRTTGRRRKPHNPNQLKVLHAIRQIRRKWDPLFKTKEQRCARDIQRVFRGYRARKRASTMHIQRILLQFKKRDHAVVLIQIQWRKRMRRRKEEVLKRNAAASRMQALARSRQAGQLRERLLDMVYAARVLQRSYRGYRTRLWFRNVREEWRQKQLSSVQLQRLWRGYLSRRQVEHMLEVGRWRAESRVKGLRELEIARRRRKEEMVVLSLKSRVGCDGPVQNVFRAFTKEPKPQLSLEQLVKMFRGSVDRKSIEVVFSKVKERGQNTLGFVQFTSAIAAISTEVSSPKRTLSPVTLVTEELLCRDWARDINTRLEDAIEEKLHSAASHIQACFRSFHLQKLFIASRGALTVCKGERERSRNATKIQAQWRRRLARRRLLRKLERVILKYIDPESGEAFWHNTDTGASTWEKPSILRGSDVKTAVALPDVDEEFVIHCGSCDHADASVLCYDCKLSLCEDCFRVQHLKGSALRHDSETIKTCGDCGYQAASRTCESCSSVCCCSCFQTLHAVHSHRWSPIVVQCKECDTRAARFVCDVCEDPLCTKCFTSLHSKGKKRLHTYKTLQYQTLRLDKLQREEAEQLRLQAAAAEVQRLQNVRKEARMQKAVVQFQARWRGIRARREGLAFLKQERKRLRQEYLHEKRDRAEKRRLVYAVKDLLGRAPILATDSESERARKQHGWKGTKWGSALLRLGVLPAMPIARQLDGVARVEVGQEDVAIFADLSEEELSAGDWIKLQDSMYQVTGVRKDVERQKRITVVTLDPEVEGEEDADPVFVRVYNFGQLSTVQRAAVLAKRAAQKLSMRNGEEEEEEDDS